MTALRVAFAGTPDFALPALHALARSRHELVGVLTQPDRPKGRGQRLTPSPVKEAALAIGVPVAQPHSLRSEADQAELRAWHPDVLVVVAYGIILPRAVLEIPRLGCINIHASLLPRWRGAAPIQRAILAGDAETGVTIMQMDVGLDTGPMLLQQRAAIRADDSGGSLHDRLAELGAVALLEALEGLVAGTLRAEPQPAEGVTYAAKIEKSEALIDWRRSAVEVDRQVRAFNPWPVAEARLAGEPLRIHRAHIEEYSGSSVAPGTIVAARSEAIVVQCGEGRLAITELQRPGRRPVSARDFVNARDLAGERFEQPELAGHPS